VRADEGLPGLESVLRGDRLGHQSIQERRHVASIG
jgi:hypothetical protein